MSDDGRLWEKYANLEARLTLLEANYGAFSPQAQTKIDRLEAEVRRRQQQDADAVKQKEIDALRARLTAAESERDQLRADMPTVMVPAPTDTVPGVTPKPQSEPARA